MIGILEQGVIKMKVYKSEAWKNRILSSYDKLMEGWNVPVKEVSVPGSYGTTHVSVFGNPEGEPICLFHGLGDNSALMWIYNAAALEKHFMLYAIDTIGGPGKSIPNGNYNKEFDDALWIDEILNYFNLDQVNMVGVSNGGYLIQYYALMRPERVKKILALASSVPVTTGSSPMKTIIKVFCPEALFPSKRNILKLLIKLSGKNYAVFTQNPLILEHYTYLLRGFNKMAMGYHKVIGFGDDQIQCIKEKCLYLVGEADPFAKLGGKAMLEQYHMNTKFIPDVGHGINHEISDEINTMIIDYFK